MIGLVDPGTSNIASVSNMLDRIGAEHVTTSDPAVVGEVDAIVLPGVGAFDRGMASLEAAGLVPVLEERVRRDRVPVLGICLGMQLLARSSEEGARAGLGWLDADVVRLEADASAGVVVPHMGWNEVQPCRPGALFPDGAEGSRFWFVHSYHVVCDDPADVAATARHGTTFAAAVEHGNVMGVQFHPEKSHRFGMALLERFAVGVARA